MVFDIVKREKHEICEWTARLRRDRSIHMSFQVYALTELAGRPLDGLAD